jgi:hypothetical protein
MEESERPHYEVSSEQKEKAEFWSVIIFEFLGTLLLVYGSLASQ